MNIDEQLWKLYISPEEVEDVWRTDEPKVLAELKQTYGIDKPFDGYARIFWEKQITNAWHEGWDLRYAYERTGRPCSPNVDMWGIRESSKVHLEDCFRQPMYVDALHTPLLLDCPSLICVTCGNYTIGSESKLYCARCYRKLLNNWSP